MADPARPVAARPAATVMLLRDGEHGMEVFVQRRAKAMSFAGGVVAFPGGGVDESDYQGSATWHGPDRAWWASRWKCEQKLAEAIVRSAIRELFEECGLLLAATEAGDSTVPTRTELVDQRARLIAKEISFDSILTSHQLALRTDMVRPWANWITPEARPRRYDTRFFVAELPAGQTADDQSTEISEAYWRRPSVLLDDGRAGEVQLMAPTRTCLEELAAMSDVRSVLDSATTRNLDPIMPVVAPDPVSNDAIRTP
jgi:8-oxo-dGTP pyrophosphatase MutT (NUDIX family)